MKWSTTAFARTNAPPERVWTFWTDVGNWKEWDELVVTSALDGAFDEGARGTLQPKGGPKSGFVLTRVQPWLAFTTRSSLPLTRLEFIHEMRVEGQQTIIEHRVEMSGALTFLFRRLVGRSIERGLPCAVEKLARMAEAGQ
jgi:hypothetical protein